MERGGLGELGEGALSAGDADGVLGAAGELCDQAAEGVAGLARGRALPGVHLRLLPLPPPAAVAWPGEEPSLLERLEALEAEELRLLALGPCGRVLPEVEDRLRRLEAERTELAPLVTRASARV